MLALADRQGDARGSTPGGTRSPGDGVDRKESPS
jgi:hypothetical protein